MRAQAQTSPVMALQALVDSIKALRTTGVMDMKLSDMLSTVHALVPVVSMPLWLPLSFMLSVFSYFIAVIMYALDVSEPCASLLGPQHRPDGFKLRRMSSASSLPQPTASRGSKCAILRSMDQILDLVTSLPATSPKYSFARSLAEQLLADNLNQKPPLVDLNRAALTKAMSVTVDQLEACFSRGGTLASLVRRCSQAAGWATSLRTSDLASPPPSARAEKLSLELLWLAEKLFTYGGGMECLRMWTQSGALAEAARFGSPRVQGNLVKLSALLVRAVSGTDPTVSALLPQDSLDTFTLSNLSFAAPDASLGGSQSPGIVPITLAPLNMQYRLLLLWLPLMCRAMHAGDGPILSISEKQRTEDALQRTILKLSHTEQEKLFASWLHEYSWSSSDWPNLQSPYMAWCERARRIVTLSEDLDGLN